MDVFFVRIYTMADGSKNEVPTIYQSYEQAQADLLKFNPSLCLNCGCNKGMDMALVSYVSIEKRFSPTPIWDKQ